MTLTTEVATEAAAIAPHAPTASFERRDLEIAFNLSPMTAHLLLLLLTRKAVSSEEAQREISSACDTKIAAFRLRKCLTKFDVKIHSQRYTGYWMSDEDKEKLLNVTSGVIGGRRQ